MKKRLMKMLVAVLLAVTTLFSLVACNTNTNNEKTWLDEYLCIQHEYGGGVVEREATCLREGRIKYVCTKCGGGEKVEKLVRKAHIPYTVNAKEATCGAFGYTEHEACAVCSAVLSEKQTLPKTSCILDAQDRFSGADWINTYEGRGNHVCYHCGKNKKYYPETVVTETNFELWHWYRFYFSSLNALATITLTPTYGSFGTLTHNVEGDFDIVEITFNFKMSYMWYVENVYFKDSDGTTYGAYVAEVDFSGHYDYFELCIVPLILEGETTNGCPYSLELTDSAYTVDIDITDGELVRLDGAAIDAWPRGSVGIQ